MELNGISPAPGSRKRKRRVGRGPGSGWGKTSARGQKGQRARAGGGVRAGFEGGQLPLQMRVPKFGFRSRVGLHTAEVRLGELSKIQGETVDMAALQAANVVPRNAKRARIMLSGEIDRALTVNTASGVKVTRGARAAIETAGGKVED